MKNRKSLSKTGYGRLVIMDIDYYEKTLGKLYEAKLIEEGLENLKNGKVVKGSEVKEKIQKKGL